MKQKQHIRHYKTGKRTLVNRGLVKRPKRKMVKVPSEICECGGTATFYKMDHGVPILKCQKCGDTFEAVPKEEYKRIKLRPKIPTWHKGYTLYFGVKSPEELYQLQKNGGIDDIETESFKQRPKDIPPFEVSKSVVVPKGVLVEEDFDDAAWKDIPNSIPEFEHRNAKQQAYQITMETKDDTLSDRFEFIQNTLNLFDNCVSEEPNKIIIEGTNKEKMQEHYQHFKSHANEYQIFNVKFEAIKPEDSIIEDGDRTGETGGLGLPVCEICGKESVIKSDGKYLCSIHVGQKDKILGMWRKGWGVKRISDALNITTLEALETIDEAGEIDKDDPNWKESEDYGV